MRCHDLYCTCSAPIAGAAAVSAATTTAVLLHLCGCDQVCESSSRFRQVELTRLAKQRTTDVDRSNTHHLIHSRREGAFEEFRVFRDAAAENAIVGVVRFGDTVEGHRGIVHGGCTAAVVDELCGWASQLCVPESGRGTYVTANLNIDYRAPLLANTTVVVRVQVALCRRDARRDLGACDSQSELLAHSPLAAEMRQRGSFLL